MPLRPLNEIIENLAALDPKSPQAKSRQKREEREYQEEYEGRRAKANWQQIQKKLNMEAELEAQEQEREQARQEGAFELIRQIINTPATDTQIGTAEMGMEERPIPMATIPGMTPQDKLLGATQAAIQGGFNPSEANTLIKGLLGGNASQSGIEKTIMRDGKPTRVLFDKNTGKEIAVLGEAPGKASLFGNLTVDARTMAPTESTVTAIQKDLVEQEKALGELDRSVEMWNPEFSTATFQIGQKAKSITRRWGTNKDLSKFGLPDLSKFSQKEAQYLRWRFGAEMAAFKMRKFITGVAGGEKEMETIMGMLPNVSDDPMAYINKLYEWQAITSRTINKMQGFLAEGIPLIDEAASKREGKTVYSPEARQALEESKMEYMTEQINRQQFSGKDAYDKYGLERPQ